MRDEDANSVRPTRGKLLGEALLGEYVSPGGIHVVASLKKNPKVKKVRILAIGGPFTNSKGKEQTYRAFPGQIAHVKIVTRRMKITLGRKTHVILENEDIIAVEG